MKEYYKFKPEWLKEYPFFDKEWKRFCQVIIDTKISHGLNMEDLYVLLSGVNTIPNNGTYVEIGSGGGSSIIAVAQFRPDVKCYGIDISTSLVPIEATNKVGVKNIQFLIGRGSEEVCKEWDRDIDLLFIDGEHYFKNIFWDYIGWYPFVKKGGMMMFHDMENWDEGKFDVGMALKIFLEHPKYDSFFAALNGNISSSIVSIKK